jgi:prepilin-type N-terminal cleavage/methylation domain-containing protein
MILKFQNKGFTLAEVLITLLVIGVISSLVIPGLINDTQDQELRQKFRKDFAELSQAIRLIAIDNGGSFRNVVTSYGDIYQSKYLANYMKTMKTCVNSKTNGCWHQDGVVKYKNGNPYNTNDYGGMILQDGALMRWESWDNSCGYIWHVNFDVCASIAIDINGFKGPNIWGKDVYRIFLLDKNLVPAGISGDILSDDCSDTGTGCAIKVLQGINE